MQFDAPDIGKIIKLFKQKKGAELLPLELRIAGSMKKI